MIIRRAAALVLAVGLLAGFPAPGTAQDTGSGEPEGIPGAAPTSVPPGAATTSPTAGGASTATTSMPAGGPSSSAAPSSTLVSIDRPASGAITLQRFTIIGWAVDPEATGSGVDAVHVYLDGEAGEGAFLGAATYGEERTDVARQLGQPRFGLSGYQLQVEVAPGPHTLYVYARQRGGTGGERWSAAATVDVMAAPDLPATEAARSQARAPSCSRAPDGTCVGRSPVLSPTCPQAGPDGQCAAVAPGSVPPGWVGAPSAPPTAVPAGSCAQMDASSRCVAYSNAPTAPSGGIVLRGNAGSGMTQLSWTTYSGAQNYEILRCNSAAGQGCSSVAIVTTTTYQLPRTANTYYQVQARGAGGQVLAVSNVLTAS